MNKRLKKKRELEIKVARLVAENVLLMDAVKRHQALLEKMQQINTRNAQATNARLSVLESDNNSMRVDLSNAIAEFGKNKKKGLLGRKQGGRQ